MTTQEAMRILSVLCCFGVLPLIIIGWFIELWTKTKNKK